MAVGPGHAGVSGVQAPSLLRTAGGWALGPGGRTPYLRRGSPLGPFRWGRGARWAPLDLEPSRAESKLAQRSRPCLSGPFGSLPRPGASSRCGAPLRTRRGAPAPGAEPAARRAAVPRPGGRRNPRAAAGPEPGGAQGTGRPAARPLHKARPCSGASDACPGPRPPGVPCVPRALPGVPTAPAGGRAACRGRRREQRCARAPGALPGARRGPGRPGPDPACVGPQPVGHGHPPPTQAVQVPLSR